MRPTLLFYCQHSLGMGHLVRSFSLAAALAERFRVVLLNGGRLPDGIAVPPEVEVVDLPPLGMDESSRLVSHDPRYTVAEAQAARREQILAAYDALRPEALFIELFPFGRKKFAGELLPLLRAARRDPRGRPRVFCSLRDILVGSRRDQQRHDDRAAWLVNRYFDGVLVHTDPEFARLEESFHPRSPLRAPVRYTGFVVPGRRLPAVDGSRSGVVVSAGGGIVGGPLLHAAAEAHTVLWEEARLPMTLVAGPFLPEAEWQSLQAATAGQHGLRLLRSVPDLPGLLTSAAASVSQCGYNTAFDLLRARVPALVVPFTAGREDEQMNRARRLERLRLIKVLEPRRLSGAALAAAIRVVLGFRPGPLSLDLDGARNTAQWIHHEVAAAQQPLVAEPVAK